MARREKDGSEIFGPGNTWWDVQKHALTNLRRYCPGVATELREDAVSHGLAVTMGDWTRWQGSIVPDNPGLTFAGAKRVCTLTARTYLRDERARQLAGSAPQTTPTERRTTVAAAAVIGKLQDDEREWTAWARDFLAGDTEEEAAERQGVSQQAISRRRQRGFARIRPLLRQHGLIGGHT